MEGKSNTPLVSIIMGSYNGENRLSKSIESIINQTYTNWEFIICDDCSFDGTLDVLRKYREKDKRIKIIRNRRNMKLAASLNHCLKKAQGKYIARMDDDDVSLPERLEKQVKFLNDHPEYEVVGSAVELTDGNRVYAVRQAKEFPTKKDVLTGPPFIHPSIMMRKTAYDRLKGYVVSDRTKRGQDWDLWFRFFAAGFSGYNIQQPLLIYHESKDDHKKRTLKAAIGYTRTAFQGFRMLRVSVPLYVFAFKPFVSFFIPESVKRIHRKELN